MRAHEQKDGRKARLRDRAGDDKCFMFVSPNLRVSQRASGESKSEMICQSASFCGSLSEHTERFEVYIYTSWQSFSFYRQQFAASEEEKFKVCDTERGEVIRTQDD